MSKELLEVREEEAKVQLSVRVTERALALIEGYAQHTKTDRGSVVEALAEQLTGVPSAKVWWEGDGVGKSGARRRRSKAAVGEA